MLHRSVVSYSYNSLGVPTTIVVRSYLFFNHRRSVRIYDAQGREFVLNRVGFNRWVDPNGYNSVVIRLNYK